MGLKRYTPLTSHTVLKRGAPLARGVVGLARSRLKPMSDKRRREGDARQRAIEEAMRRHPTCVAKALVPEVHCWGPLDADEVQGRGVRPGGHLDGSNVQMICRAHHRWKHEHPERAHELGLTKWSWE